ncbi:MAG: MBOAT family protein [Deltaproteobacteria bacterium]|nr:MBOAT family protein [Deltaproteobacteria bacterium]
MVFSSLLFLFLFLPSVLACYYLAGRRYRNAVLLAFSYIFYFWGSGEVLAILVLSTLADYLIGLKIDSGHKAESRKWVILSVAINLSFLAYFKYSNFFIGELNRAFGSFGMGKIGWAEVLLPTGISFFTFHKITYIVDIYRGTRKSLRSFIDFGLYIAFFPQLIAGPIVRFHEISEQLKKRSESLNDFYCGTLRFSWGLVKKVLIADACGEIADSVFSIAPSLLDTKTAWLGTFSYALQIYFDFSAYADMAIGLGMMFGFHLPENFRRPYSSLSITDFWRRWHISLSNFFRDYLYIPLGGNRAAGGRVYLNLMIVFALCGMWHGASWTFLVWGVYHGALLTIERLTGLRRTEPGSFDPLRRFVTLVLVLVGWALFRAVHLSQAVLMIKAMFVPVNHTMPVEVSLSLNYRNLLFLAIGSVAVFLPREFSGLAVFDNKRPVLSAALTGALFVLVLYSFAFIASGSFNPFIYFRF